MLLLQPDAYNPLGPELRLKRSLVIVGTVVTQKDVKIYFINLNDIFGSQLFVNLLWFFVV